MLADEKSLIARIVGALPHRHAALRIGPGDDAAVTRTFGECVVSCDAFLEGVHFRRDIHPPDSVGYKSLARASSDLAAMGVPLDAPRFFLVTLALPQEKCRRWLDEFLGGMRRCARELRMTLAGGDVSQQERVAISITVLAMARRDQLVTRSGARPSDALYVSGELGLAEMGFHHFMRKHNSHRGPWPPEGRRIRLPRDVQRHLYPQIRLEPGAWLAREGVATAMIDTSDGLSTDLHNLCEASHVGVRVFADALPIAGNSRDASALKRALHGGEDYELLFTASARRKLPAQFRGVPITRIGEITRGRKIVLVSARGKSKALRAGGWDPFRE
jgi:thiamine-monophosphate kinase